MKDCVPLHFVPPAADYCTLCTSGERSALAFENIPAIEGKDYGLSHFPPCLYSEGNLHFNLEFQPVLNRIKWGGALA